MSKKAYPYIDIMRVISSILVIGIHTYPFLTLNPNLDFVFTNILGRIAVPFFFMTTAFFLFQKGYPTGDKLKTFFKQIIIIYLISILLYLPIQFYNHSFPSSILEYIKDIFIDGTFYHLWYLPATLIGTSIICILLKYFSTKIVFMLVIVLYIIGLGGDSYYGIATHSFILKNIYDYIFMICDYTRNGLFFAPIYIYLGIYISKHNFPIQKNKLKLLFLIFFSLMCIETVFIHSNHIFKHDAMSIFLLPTMYCLYYILLQFKGKRLLICKDLSLYIYILHPIIIILLRLVAKLTHLEMYFIDNNLIHFLSVTLILIIISYAIMMLRKGLFSYDKSFGFRNK